MKSLRILIQHRFTKEFYKSVGRWTFDEAEALEFSDVLTAFNLAVQNNFEEMEIIFARRSQQNCSAQDRGNAVAEPVSPVALS